jgi:hypothetical protein
MQYTFSPHNDWLAQVTHVLWRHMMSFPYQKALTKRRGTHKYRPNTHKSWVRSSGRFMSAIEAWLGLRAYCKQLSAQRKNELITESGIAEFDEEQDDEGH